jgi:hypothetical protein
MKYISILSLLLFTVLASCSTNRAAVDAQKSDFSVTPKYCYINECFTVIRATRIQLHNHALPNGNYKSETKSTIISGGKSSVQTEYIRTHVKDDIVTIDTKDFVGMYNQKTREIIEIAAKTGEISNEQSEILKDLFKQMAGLSYNNYASSGDVINNDVRIPFQSAMINLKAEKYVYGLTEYKGKNYPLLEWRGETSFWLKGKKIIMSLSGYSIQDGTLNRTVKSVIDLTFRYGNKEEKGKIIIESM